MKNRNEPFNVDRYLSWRATLPFTDAQFAQAMNDAADEVASASPYLAQKYRNRAAQIAKGFLCSYDLRLTLDRLITSCAICGKKALYRWASEGRCSVHRFIKDVHTVNRNARLDTRSAMVSESTKQFDAFDKDRRTKKSTAKYGKQKRRP